MLALRDSDRGALRLQEEFKLLCHFVAEAYSYSMKEDISRGDELACAQAKSSRASQRLIHLAVDRMWLNCFAYGCLIVDMARPPLRFCWDGSVVCQC